MMIIQSIKQFIIDLETNKYCHYCQVLSTFNPRDQPPLIRKDDWNFYAKDFGQQHMFIMQNPGEALGSKRDQEKIHTQRNLIDQWNTAPQHKKDESLVRVINQMQEDLVEWLVQKNTHFHQFFTILMNKKLDGKQIIQTMNPVNYLQHQFLQDFYVTDIFKYRIATGKLGKALIGRPAEKKQFRHKLMHDIEEEILHVKPKLIFIFSTRAWDSFYEYFHDKQLLTNPQSPSNGKTEFNKVAQVHGMPFNLKLAQRNITVIPMCHFSPRYYHMLIKGSYFDYFQKNTHSILS